MKDTLELRLNRSNRLRFEARGPAGRDVTIRDPVRHVLRHRLDHIVGRRGARDEAADLLYARYTAYGGSLATVQANDATAALPRLATCAMQASDDLPVGGRPAAAWSTASRPSFTRRGRPNGTGPSSR